MISVNKRAVEIIRQMIVDGDALGISVNKLAIGTMVIDAGINVPGSFEAGRLFGEVCLGGLGQIRFCELEFKQLPFAGVVVTVNLPVVACMASQYAGWAINVKENEKSHTYMAMGSGPARALYGAEPLFEKLNYRDQADIAVLVLESNVLPSETVARWIADKCCISPKNLYLLVAPTASIVGSVQIAARIVETGLHKMLELGFDIETVLSGFGTCPLAPIARDDLRAIGRTNDAVLYGGRAWYSVRTEDSVISEFIEKLPSSSSRDYGSTFYDLFQRYGGDFYKVDPLLFAPADIIINNVSTGSVYHAGAFNVNVLRQSLLGEH
jgi:methenyltetrahydromethanopterin cyclohydrolase